MGCDCNCHVYHLSKDSTGECCECKVGDPVDKLRAILRRLYDCVPAIGHHAIPAYDCPERDLAKAMNKAAKALGKPAPYPAVEGDVN